jgi:hypothetical protein
MNWHDLWPSATARHLCAVPPLLLLPLHSAIDEAWGAWAFRVDQLEMHACDAPAYRTITPIIHSAAPSISRAGSEA